MAQTFGSEHVVAMDNIIAQESGFNLYAKNPTSGACGLGQALPCTKMLDTCRSFANSDCQIDWVVNYVKNRYGNPQKAWNFEVANGWY